MHDKESTDFHTSSPVEEPDQALLCSAREHLLRRVWMAGLWPAFRDSRTGETHLATTQDGACTMQHSFDGLPDRWVVDKDASGNATGLHPAIQAGYWRSPDFFAIDGKLSLPLDS